MGQTKNQIVDVAIVGAGPAGAATATHLARAGYQVTVVDRAIFPRDKPCAEYLSPAAEPLLRHLGVLTEIERAQPARLRGFRVFAPNGRMFQGDFAATRGDDGECLYETGLAVPRLYLDLTLISAARSAGAELREGWRLAHIEYDQKNECWRLSRAGDTTSVILARLLVAADGVHSTVARRLGLQVPSRIRKMALVAHMRGISGLSTYGEMHVTGRRYVGLAPLEPFTIGDCCNVAMVVDEARDGWEVARLRPEKFLLDALKTFPQLKGRLDRATIVRKTLTTSGIRVRVRKFSDHALLLVGDASGYYDPFTGEGIYRALRGAELAADVAVRALASCDMSSRALAAYDKLQRHEFRGKRTIEAIIQSAVQHPPLMNHIACRMERRKAMADTIVAVTGDFLPTASVLRPGYLMRLVV